MNIFKSEPRINKTHIGKRLLIQRAMRGIPFTYYEPEEITIEEVKDNYFKYHENIQSLINWAKWCDSRYIRVLTIL